MSYAGWAVVEIFGHRRHVGYVTEDTVFGAVMLKVQVPHPDAETPEWKSTHLYGGAAIFAVTPISEKEARAANKAQVLGYSHALPEHSDDETDPAPPLDDCDTDDVMDALSTCCTVLGTVHGEENCSVGCSLTTAIGGAEHHWLRKESRPHEPGDTTPDHEAEKMNLAVWLQCAHCHVWAEITE